MPHPFPPRAGEQEDAARALPRPDARPRADAGRRPERPHRRVPARRDRHRDLTAEAEDGARFLVPQRERGLRAQLVLPAQRRAVAGQAMQRGLHRLRQRRRPRDGDLDADRPRGALRHALHRRPREQPSRVRALARERPGRVAPRRVDALPRLEPHPAAARLPRIERRRPGRPGRRRAAEPRQPADAPRAPGEPRPVRVLVGRRRVVGPAHAEQVVVDRQLHLRPGRAPPRAGARRETERRRRADGSASSGGTEGAKREQA